MNNLEKFKASGHGELFSNFFEDSVKETKLQYDKSEINVDWTYAMMHIVAQKFLIQIFSNQNKRSTLLDVGSQFSFILFATTFFDVYFLEQRAKNISIQADAICNLKGLSGEAQNIPTADSNFDIVTSLHAIEHFGLGRYGDRLDYYGDHKGIHEFARILKSGGFFLSGVPTASKSRVDFNDQRIYNPDDFDSICEKAGFKKLMGCIAYPPGSRVDQIVLGTPETILTFPENFTPPVYIGVYEKPENWSRPTIDNVLSVF